MLVTISWKSHSSDSHCNWDFFSKLLSFLPKVVLIVLCTILLAVAGVGAAFRNIQ